VYCNRRIDAKNVLVSDRFFLRWAAKTVLVDVGFAKLATTGVCPNGWIAISSGGEKRFKAWYAADVLNGYVITAWVIASVVLGGAVVRDWTV
jgi:hypothetical protein